MPKNWTFIALMGSLVLAVPAQAQRHEDKQQPAREIPKAYRPPPGMCRVWLDDVPPSQQPAPTNCKTALRNKPAKAQVIFGDDYVDKDRKREPTLKGFKGARTAKPTPGSARSARPAPPSRGPWRKP